MHACMHACIMHVYVPTQGDTHTDPHICMYTYICIHIHIYIHICTYAYIILKYIAHIYSHVQLIYVCQSYFIYKSYTCWTLDY